MVTLGQLEGHDGLAAFTQGAMKEAVRHIVGTQFRNMATVGGSISGRFGFSDIWTLFLAWMPGRIVQGWHRQPGRFRSDRAGGKTS